MTRGEIRFLSVLYVKYMQYGGPALGRDKIFKGKVSVV